MEKTGIVYMVALHRRDNQLRCEIELKGGNCDYPFSRFTFTGGMIEQARALTPADNVTIICNEGLDSRTHYIGLSIIGLSSIV